MIGVWSADLHLFHHCQSNQQQLYPKQAPRSQASGIPTSLMPDTNTSTNPIPNPNPTHPNHSMLYKPSSTSKQGANSKPSNVAPCNVFPPHTRLTRVGLGWLPKSITARWLVPKLPCNRGRETTSDGQIPGDEPEQGIDGYGKTLRQEGFKTRVENAKRNVNEPRTFA